ncbi:MAG: flagellar hook-basal body complex protein FliE [Candidatus Eisenbacteria bacterium]|uniref:Flagellar hook-basal body complex protein FliE n=1 Tax=Eiseniibacteriota bacterium TaxID=2212470 RepID=A0A956RQQ3_UNCEI|nr:flagellar hook-basal body complex protein FliE [Candidatus Eisenbacteria bacterium]
MAGINGIGAGGGIRIPGELPDANRMQGLNDPLRSQTLGEAGRLPGADTTDSNTSAGFAQTLGNLVSDVNQLQHRSDDTFRAFLRGQAELHDVALASHEASIAMRLTAEIRNKLLDAYREVMRTPM